VTVSLKFAETISCNTFSNSLELSPYAAHPGNLCVDDNGNLVFYDFGMMDELKPNVREGFRKFCTALFAGGPTIDDIGLAKNAKQLVDGVEQAGVLAKGSDRLAVEKLARYFMRAFKDNQLGKKSGNIKQTLGTDLQTLTENDSFRFPSTFTFIFRAFASIGTYCVENSCTRTIDLPTRIP
jgi:predicted unusual protein kinase regulating ubiquinone biosynthesis (AarF/ABC1/UbiB family)